MLAIIYVAVLLAILCVACWPLLRRSLHRPRIVGSPSPRDVTLRGPAAGGGGTPSGTGRPSASDAANPRQAEPQ